MKNKKVMSMIAVMMAAVLAAGCGIGSAPAASAPAASEAAPAASEAAPAAEAEAPAAEAEDDGIPTTSLNVEGDSCEVSLLAGSIPENTATGAALAKMADYINKNSNGTIKAIAYYDTALGDATSMVQGMQQGTIDVGISGTAYFSGLVPEVEVYQLPFLFDSLEAARKNTASDSPSCQKIFEKLEEKGIIGLAFWENGFRELTNNVRPIEKPEDMEGIKMRTLPAPVQKATWEAMGAITTQIDASELYTALQQGTVSAQDNPLHEIVARKFYEVQPYVTLTDAVYTPFLMGMSKVTYDAMSESQQALMKEAAVWGREVQIAITDENQASALQTLIDNGCEVVENPDKAAFQEKAMPTWELFTSENGTEVLDLIEK